MFAIVKIQGKQYKLTPEQTIEVDRLEGKAEDGLEFKEVLLINDGKNTTIGAPTVAGAKVKAKIIAQVKGAKLEVRRFKSKVRSRRHRGFRPLFTKLEILSVVRA